MENSSKTTIILGIVALTALIGVLVYANNTPGKLDGFAQCLKDKGATFYGAFWCPHCQEQKRFFGNSAALLPYVDCSEADQKTQTPICIEKGIVQYPTWIFADGSKLTGEQQPADLATKTGCALPE